MADDKKDLSPLKKQRAKEKLKKQQRRAKKMQANNNDTTNTESQGPVMWDEAKQSALEVRQLITMNLDLIQNGYAATTTIRDLPQEQKTPELMETLKTLVSELAILSKDVNEFMEKWETLATPLSGKEGEVSANDLPGFYLFDQDLTTLGLDATNVITPRGETVTALIQRAVECVPTEESKSNE